MLDYNIMSPFVGGKNHEKSWKSRKNHVNHEKNPEKCWKILTFMLMTISSVKVFFFNDDQDHVQTLEKISVGIGTAICDR